MNRLVIFLMFSAIIGSATAADFQLSLIPENTELQQFGSITVNYNLKNNGPDRHIRIGMGRIEEYFFVLVAFDGESEIDWYDLSAPIYEYEQAPREFFTSGQEQGSNVTIFWQESLPVFDRIGDYLIRMAWTGPDDELVYSEPVKVTVLAP